MTVTKDGAARESMQRRGFLQLVISGLSALVVSGVAAFAGPYLFSKEKDTENESWADAGSLSDLRPGVPQQVAFERERLDAWEAKRDKEVAWVTVNSSGGVTAFSPLCTHLGCAYHWDEKATRFVCPCHGSSFGADGRVLAGPAPRALDRYDVKIEAGHVWLGPVKAQNRT
jgi:menaquinol-cytochrome c reductase iron-sulfur subunit